MHSTYQRFNQLSATLSSCLIALFFAIALSSLAINVVSPPQPKAKLGVHSVKVFEGSDSRYQYSHQSQREFAFVRFNITADVTSLFNWNTKQVFLYFAAEYTNAQGVKNDVVIWDRIVRTKKDAKVKVSAKNKYKLKDVYNSFRNASAVHYTLKYNVMPWVGVLTYGEVARTAEPIPFPPKQASMNS